MGPKLSPSDVALERVRAICLALPASGEKLSHGAPSYFAGGKLFLMFVDDHHADGRLAVWLKATPESQRALVAGDPERFFVPPYVGVKGWVGVRLDRPTTDWIELAILIEEGWASVAPKRLPRDGEARPAALSKPVVRVKTDEKVARASLARLTKICLALPEATCERESVHATFRVAKKIFVYFLDNHHGDGAIAACVRLSKRESAALVKRDPKRFYSPAYIGPRGWVGIRLNAGKVDWADVEKRVAESYGSVAPKRLAHVART